MPMNPQMGAAAAAGGGMPPQAPPAGQPPGMGAPQPQSGVGAPVQQIIDALKQIIPQVVDQKGYVNMDKLIMMWPNVSQIPFQAVMQLLQNTPDLLNEIISQYGLTGIISQGKVISADELAALGQKGGR